MGSCFRTSQKLQLRNFIHIYSNGHTEINYFILKKVQLKIKNVVVEPMFENCGNPKQMLQKIASKYSPRDIQQNDKIFCVIDVDETTDELIKEGLRIKANYIDLILSNPDFEIWFLLHFKYYTSKIMMEETLSKIREHLPEYSKVKINLVFSKLIEKEKNAIKHANQLRQYHLHSDIDLNSREANPYTSADIVVELLNSLKNNN